MQQCSQTKVKRGFTLIIDDSGHRKSGNETAGIGRQYIGEIGKTDNGVVLVTSHLYDGVKSLPLDVALYQHASSLRKGKQDPEFVKKQDIALKLVDKCLQRGEKPGVVLIDAGYGNNTTFLKQLSRSSEINSEPCVGGSVMQQGLSSLTVRCLFMTLYLESKKLKYVAGLAKNRKVVCQLKPDKEKVEIRLDE